MVKCSNFVEAHCKQFDCLFHDLCPSEITKNKHVVQPLNYVFAVQTIKPFLYSSMITTRYKTG